MGCELKGPLLQFIALLSYKNILEKTFSSSRKIKVLQYTNFTDYKKMRTETLKNRSIFLITSLKRKNIDENFKQPLNSKCIKKNFSSQRNLALCYEH